jgi:hypothetical protein
MMLERVVLHKMSMESARPRAVGCERREGAPALPGWIRESFFQRAC